MASQRTNSRVFEDSIEKRLSLLKDRILGIEHRPHELANMEITAIFLIF